jgi:uncharacterized protein (TIGR02466 family)
MDHLSLFASPVLVVRVDDMEEINKSLTERFVSESKNQKGIQRSNVGGWHSSPDLSSRKDLMLQELMEMLGEAAHVGLGEFAKGTGNTISEFQLRLQAWAMVMNKGDYTIPHDHSESHISGVYYLDAGDANMDQFPNSGLLAFLDPRGGLPKIPGLELYPSTFTVQPQTGVLVMFPGFLTHYVHPYQGTHSRVSISFNVRVSLADAV